MTRQEFNDEIRYGTWGDLIDFCESNEYYEYTENVYSDDRKCEWIEEQIREDLRSLSWQEIRDWLCDVPDYYNDYWIMGNDGWREAGQEEFDSIVDDLYEALEDNNFFGDSESEQESEEEESSIEIMDLFTA